jgi:hypothetical protein
MNENALLITTCSSNNVMMSGKPSPIGFSQIRAMDAIFESDFEHILTKELFSHQRKSFNRLFLCNP